MSLLELILTIGTFALAVYGVVTLGLLIQTINKHRDELYREKYEEFLRQKSRVMNELKKK
jgi:hypothetical protein